jgi:hypothetical protein
MTAQLDDLVPDGTAWSPFPTPEEMAFAEALFRDFPPSVDDLHAQGLGPGDVPLEGADLRSTESLSELDLLAGGTGPADPFDLVLLCALDPAALTDPVDGLTALKAAHRVEALAQSLRLSALTSLSAHAASGDYLAEIHLAHEVAVATRTSEYAASAALQIASTVTGDFPGFLRALRDGQVSWGHLAVLVDRTRFVHDPGALAAIASRALHRALTRTPGQFATEVEKLVNRFDPDAAERHRTAKKKNRKVWIKRLADGLGMLGYVDEWSVVHAVHDTITADARASRQATMGVRNADAARASNAGRPHGDAAGSEVAPSSDVAAGSEAAADERTADEGRADALAARVLGTLHPDGSVVWDRTASTTIVVDLVIDFLTLTRERDRVALLDGQPIPPSIARELAAGATMWRRMVTDPADDHLLDYGRTTYTAEPLRRYVLGRDHCRAPGHHHATLDRLQMDHAEEYPDGATSAANAGGVCIPAHQLKTGRYADITDSRADGSCTWTTRWGQGVHIPPRAFLDEPDPPPFPRRRPDPPPAPDPDDDVPPF